jgi:hypothetical protein
MSDQCYLDRRHSITVADGYGSEKPIALMKANETICEHLLDAEMRAAILRRVA